MSFFGELRRRNVFKVAMAYAIVGWLLMEVASVMGPALNLPDWSTSFVAFVLILGFPVALVLSWAYELTPEGMKKTKSVPLSQSISQATGQKLNYVVIGLLVLTVAFLVIENYALVEIRDEMGEAGAIPLLVPSAEDPSPLVTEPESEVLPNSVAVLPLENLSPDPDDAYFAAGMHEEILNQLAKLRSLNVISRTSVIRYSDSDLSIPEIADELNVETVMEGSVRYADERVLVTVQLIDPETDAHLWSESYNRDLSDVFGIQADIAMNVANALQAEFSLEEQENVGRVPTESTEAYARYLRALSSADSPAFGLLIDQAIELDPNFALAHAVKAFWHTFDLVGLGQTGPDEIAELEQLVRESAERALELDPTLAVAEAALAVPLYVKWNGTEAERAFQRAMELGPNDVDVLVLYGRFKRYRGEFDESIRLLRRAVELDPNSLVPLSQLALAYRNSGDWATAAEIYAEMLDRGATGIGAYAGAGLTEAVLGNRAEAVRILGIAEALGPNAFRLAQIAQAYALADRREDVMRVFAKFQQEVDANPVGDAVWARALIATGDYGQALQRLESAIENRIPTDLAALAAIRANPWGDPELDKPEFRALLDGLWRDE